MPTDPPTSAAADDDPPPEPPLEPSLDECCGQGCDPCIFDLYEAAQQRWRAALRAWEARHGRGATTPDREGAGTTPD